MCDGRWVGSGEPLGVLARRRATGRTKSSGSVVTGQPDGNGGLAQRRHRRARSRGCGYDAALGQRKRVVQIPTAATATAGGIVNLISDDHDGLRARAARLLSGLLDACLLSPDREGYGTR